ncbi:PqiB family protein [Vibrio viridaestus]|uniref:MCE family protein n=1 Tax=Vibrio viridaestus TaxID=2487322 RepID=A0A3N9THN7_9VIBR|nr:MlaD family protein [Vibrio viridaestus]RQW63550.1 MCE family protein [Vibrio viridaestus]
MSNEKPNSQFPVVRKARGISPLWILPILTLIIAGWLIFKAVNATGEMVTIYFDDAQGLIEGRTPIRYQGLEVGMVRHVKLEKKNDSIYVEAEVYPEASYLVNGDTKFWLVKPSASLSGISGLDALVSGNYIALLPDNLDSESDIKDAYYALKNAPTNIKNTKDLIVELTADELDGINVGSKILYKKIPIGEVIGYNLSQDNQSVSIQTSIKQEYAPLITDKSRFWNVSGVNANINFSNVDIQLESISSLLAGGIAVDSPDDGNPVESGQKYKLYDDIRSAGRGIHIQVELPQDHGLTAQSSSVLYKGMKIGQVLSIVFNKQKTKVLANIAVEPTFSDLLVNGSKFIIDQARLSLTDMKKLPNLIKGNDLILLPNPSGKERARSFTAIKESQFNQLSENALSLTLNSDSAMGLSPGSPIRYRGLSVGAVSHIEIADEGVNIHIYINNKYKYLVRSENRFYINTVASAKLTNNGVNVSIPPVSDLISGGIGFISEGNDKSRRIYRLYSSEEAANLAKETEQGTQRLTLLADSLPAISESSPVIYHNIKVGRVEKYELGDKGVVITLLIENKYSHLINSTTVFWGTSGLEVDASVNGISLKSKPVESILKGGIEFTSINGIKNKSNNRYILFKSLDEAKLYGEQITLTSPESYGITKGTSIQFKGVTVGKVSSVLPDFSHDNVLITAYVLPEFRGKIALKSSYFWIKGKSENALEVMKNIKSVIIPTIEVMPGQGEFVKQFNLHLNAPNRQGLDLILQTANRDSITFGMPVTFRGIEVGKVTNVRLGDLADRVLVSVHIDNQFAYLVRENSVFWNESGINVSVGLTGADIKTGSLQSLVTGGIAFNTPLSQPISPVAHTGDAYLLHQEKRSEWSEWNQPIAKP